MTVTVTLWTQGETDVGGGAVTWRLSPSFLVPRRGWGSTGPVPRHRPQRRGWGGTRGAAV